MKTPKILYHGSSYKIENFIEPRQATDNQSEFNCQNAVYATDRFECAAGMSLTGDQWAFADYDEEDFKVVFVEYPPTPGKTYYAYELPADSFISDKNDRHQWASLEKVPIIKTHVFTTEELSQYWRMATEEEKIYRHKKLQAENTTL